MLNKKDLHKLSSYIIIGAINVIIFSSLIFVFEKSNTNHHIATGCSYFTAVMFQYLGNAIFTFRGQIFNWEQFKRFLAINCLGLTFTILFLDYIIPYLYISRAIAAPFLMVSFALINYTLFKFWAFAQR